MTRLPLPSCAALSVESVYHSSSSLPQPLAPSPRSQVQRDASGGVPAGASNSSAHTRVIPGGAEPAGLAADDAPGPDDGSAADTRAPPDSTRDTASRVADTVRR